MCIGNEDRSPFTIHHCDTTPRPACFAEVVSIFTLHTIKGTKQGRSSEVYHRSDCPQSSLIYLLPNFQCGRQSEKGMNQLLINGERSHGLWSFPDNDSEEMTATHKSPNTAAT